MMKRMIALMALLLVTFGLVACVESNIQKITFETNQGTTIDPIEFSGSYDITNLDQVSTTKEGYTFAGWFTNASLEASSALSEDIDASLTLYAKWEIISYSITYHLDGGTNANTNPVSFTILDSVALQNPSKTGFVFAGWYKDALFTQAVSAIPAGSKANMDLYAKWSIETVTTYTITWLDEDESVLKTEEVAQGSLPFYGLENPSKAETDTHTFSFAGWSPELSLVTQNQSYTATYTMTSKFAGVPFSAAMLNTIFGFDLYTLMPNITSSDYYLIDASDETWFEVYIDFFDWTSVEADAYIASLDANLSYDDVEESWVVGDYYIYLYEDAETYPGLTVYGIVVYGDVKNGSEKADYDPAALNALFGFDIYASMPPFQSNDAELVDYSEGTYKEVYIDIFDMTEAEALAYMDALDALMVYDDVEESWVFGDYFLYVYEDTETYPGQTVYGIGIYGESNTTEPVEGVYYAFNIQNTTSTLAGSYKDTIDQTILFPGSEGKVIVRVSHLAGITGSLTPPGGLTQGNIFAATVSGNASPQTYLEIDTLGQNIQSMTFEIEARDGFSPRLTGAKIQVFNGSAWVDLAGGDFYSQLSIEMVVITISNLNASKFRILFIGNGETSNGGQVKVSNVTLLTGSSVPTLESWSDMILVLGGNLSESSLGNLLPELDGISELSLVKINNSEYTIKGAFAYEDNQTRIHNYIQSLGLKGYILNTALSANRGQSVYTLDINNDLAYAVYITYTATQVDIRIWTFDPVVEPATLNTLSTRQSINQYEVSAFGISGLPSTGTYDVLVIPVEIKDNPFPVDYLSNLNLVFNGNSAQTGWESVASFYSKSSFGALNLTFDIAPKYTTMENKSYYQGFSDEGDQYAIVEALNGLNSQVDYSQYDSNNDGTIDSVIFIYSVQYDSSTDPWWAWVYSAQYGQASSLSKLDGKDFDYYFWASYDFMNDALPGLNGLVVNAETYIHELGHLMGMPDLYPYSDTLNLGPVGGFDMMDYNAGDHGPFNKLVFGWLQPLVATTGSYQVTLDAYSTDNDGLNNTLLIPYNVNDLSDGNAFDEYLLIMFYTPNGLYNGHLNTDYVLDNAGVVIYHIDARMNLSNTYWGEYFKNDNSGTSNFIVELLEADFNASLPTTSSNGITQSDILNSGSINLSTYRWNQGGAINVSIEIAQAFNNSSTQAVLNVIVS